MLKYLSLRESPKLSKDFCLFQLRIILWFKNHRKVYKYFPVWFEFWYNIINNGTDFKKGKDWIFYQIPPSPIKQHKALQRSSQIYMKWVWRMLSYTRQSLNWSSAGEIYVFSSPEEVEVFVVQKLRDAASEMEVPVDEEDNSDVANWMD